MGDPITHREDLLSAQVGPEYLEIVVLVIGD